MQIKWYSLLYNKVKPLPGKCWILKLMWKIYQCLSAEWPAGTDQSKSIIIKMIYGCCSSWLDSRLYEQCHSLTKFYQVQILCNQINWIWMWSSRTMRRLSSFNRSWSMPSWSVSDCPIDCIIYEIPGIKIFHCIFMCKSKQYPLNLCVTRDRNK